VGTILQKFDAVLLDLDGTMYHEDNSLPGAVDLVRMLQRMGIKFACLSNSTTSPLRVMSRMERMGVNIDPSNIYTAAAATADYVLHEFEGRPRIFNVATEGIQEMLDGMVDWVFSGGEPCHAVIIGNPTNVYATDERLRIALQLARRKARILGISADRVYPSARGIEFGCGALTQMLAYAAGEEATFCGKPQRVFFENLCRRLGVQPERCVAIGDNVEADIVGAKSLGMQTILTLTGVTRRKDLRELMPHLQPDYVIEELTELLG
jgi:4-nitrophenyl phosphatase